MEGDGGEKRRHARHGRERQGEGVSGAWSRTVERLGDPAERDDLAERSSWRFIRLLVAWQDQRDAGQRHPRAAFISTNVRAHGRRETNVASNAWACAV